jgi:1-acyl-sn-glycerol-3-phosphate acyltransferase
MAGVVWAAGYIPNDDPERFIEACVACLERGENLIVFPESTRTVPGQRYTRRKQSSERLRLIAPRAERTLAAARRDLDGGSYRSKRHPHLVLDRARGAGIPLAFSYGAGWF